MRKIIRLSNFSFSRFFNSSAVAVAEKKKTALKKGERDNNVEACYSLCYSPQQNFLKEKFTYFTISHTLFFYRFIMDSFLLAFRLSCLFIAQCNTMIFTFSRLFTSRYNVQAFLVNDQQLKIINFFNFIIWDKNQYHNFRKKSSSLEGKVKFSKFISIIWDCQNTTTDDMFHYLNVYQDKDNRNWINIFFFKAST